MFGSPPNQHINQIIMNTETNAIAAFYGTPLSYWSRLDCSPPRAISRSVTGVITLASSDVVTTNDGRQWRHLAGTARWPARPVASGAHCQPGSGAGRTFLKISGSLAFSRGRSICASQFRAAVRSANCDGRPRRLPDCQRRVGQPTATSSTKPYHDPDL